ncbi:MAG: ABC transporter ATP-binding protein, partial [Verrucomicrobiota bacterium]
MLSIENLNIHYSDAQVVCDLTLEIPKGEILALVGPTGCGKSSALRAIAGLIKPTSGDILIDGQSTCQGAPLPPEKRNAGMVFQDFALFPHLNVEANIGFRVSDKSLVSEWLSNLGLQDFAKAMPETLSGGQKQRVALARSLAHQPKLLLLDEPLSNLDAALKIELRAQIRDAIKQAGVTAVWVTHDQEEAMAIGDRIAVMNAGRLEQVDTPVNCYESPCSRFVAKFFGDGRFLAARPNENGAASVLGQHPIERSAICSPVDNPDSLEILVRPHDIDLAINEPSNAKVLSQVYEGETRRYLVELDSGETIDARLSHECEIPSGSRVRAFVDS